MYSISDQQVVCYSVLRWRILFPGPLSAHPTVEYKYGWLVPAVSRPSQYHLFDFLQIYNLENLVEQSLLNCQETVRSSVRGRGAEMRLDVVDISIRSCRH